jgi:copper oxidase (laccase) domain-containing protein
MTSTSPSSYADWAALCGGRAEVICSDPDALGDLSPVGALEGWTSRPYPGRRPLVGLERRRRRLAPGRRLVWLHQIHGRSVVSVGRQMAGSVGDALVSPSGSLGSDPALAIFHADCAPVSVADPNGTLAIVHVGWRGLASGILARAIEAMVAARGREAGPGRGGKPRRPEVADPEVADPNLGLAGLEAHIGPSLCRECGQVDADTAAMIRQGAGETACVRDPRGVWQLDLRSGIIASLVAAGVSPGSISASKICPACRPDLFSHRARGDRGRHMTTIRWVSEGGSVGSSKLGSKEDVRQEEP